MGKFQEFTTERHFRMLREFLEAALYIMKRIPSKARFELQLTFEPGFEHREVL